MRRIDISGQRFGRQVALRVSRGRLWLCRCDCGSLREVHGSSLRNGKVTGCIECRPKPDHAITHGCEPWRLYQIWSSMLQRCGNPNNNSYERYGARGITVCQEWRDDFVPFRDWALTNGYQNDLSIERANNNKGYSPDNCKWATVAEQSVNKRTTRRVEYRGVMTPLATLARNHSIPIETLYGRIQLNWPIERALSTPVAGKRTAARIAAEMSEG